MSTRRLLHLLVLLLLATALGAACKSQGAPAKLVEVRRSQLLMGTVVEIIARGPDRPRLETAVDGAFAELARIEKLMEPHGLDSDVGRLFKAGIFLEVSPDTAAVIAQGLKVATASGGVFDMGLGRLKELWDIEGEHPQPPSAAAIAQALAGTGLGDLQLNGRVVQKRDPGLVVDLGGIAKGYGIDRAIGVLAAAGVEHASINAGGDIRLLGNRGNRPWRIGIQHPRHPGEILATIDLADTAVVTSGDYERFYERDGVRYHHLFDPRTGQPGRLCQSVTVVAPEAVLADALATAVFILGPQAGLELLARFRGVEGLIVAADGTSVTTPGLADQVKWR